MVNIQQVMKQAQDLQKKMGEMQEKLGNAEVSGLAGGGLVKIITSAKGDIKKVHIDKSLMVPEESEVLEDLIIAAFNNAKQSADSYMADEMKKFGLSPDLLKGML